MYMILKWGIEYYNASGKLVFDPDFLGCIKNNDGSIKLFEKLEVADKVANESPGSEDLRVISIEGVQE